MRCNICDYSSSDGSPLLDKSPDRFVVVSWYEKHKQFLCSICAFEIKQNLQDLKDKDIDEYGD